MDTSQAKERTITMEKISATVICMKEEGNIQKCLESLDFVDEIVIINSGATERTLDICKKFTDRIIHHPWPKYGQQINFAMDQNKNGWVLCSNADEVVSPELKESILNAFTNNEWILCLNADEVISPELKESILNAFTNDGGKYNGYRVKRRIFHLGRGINHCWYQDFQIRFFRKSKASWISTHSHYSVNLEGTYRDLKGDLECHIYHSLSQHLCSIDSFSSSEAMGEFERGKSVHLFGLVFNPLFYFFKLYVLQRGFLDGTPGFIISVTESYYCFLKYAKLWEMKNVNPFSFAFLHPNLGWVKNLFLRKQHQN